MPTPGCCLDREDCWISWEDVDGEEVPILNFSENLLERLDWEEGDELVWEELPGENGAFIIRKETDES